MKNNLDSTTNTVELLEPKRTDLHSIDPRSIEVIDNFNVRVDMGNIEELKSSIKENGVKVPLRGYKSNGTFYLTDGHRRLKACMLLISEGITLRVPFISEKQGTEEDRIIEMFISNSGKPLNPMEESELVRRLVSLEFSQSEIAKRLGCSLSKVYNLVLLGTIPNKLKKQIASNEVSASLVLSILKDEAELSIDEIADKVGKLITDKKEKGDTKKLTKKDITVTKTDVIVDEPKTDITAVNSFAILKKLIAKLPENIVENKSLYYFAVNIIENNLIESDIVKLFGKAE